MIQKTLTLLLVVMTIALHMTQPCAAQEIVLVKHTLQRGESLSSLAATYGATTEVLKKLNYDLDTLFTGMEVNIPVNKDYADHASSMSSEELLCSVANYVSNLNQATTAYGKGKYKEAHHFYDYASREAPLGFACNEAHFGMGMCNYKRKKWQAAIKDFYNVKGNDEMHDCSQRLIASCKEKVEERRQRRAQIVGSIFQAAAEVGTAYMSAASQAQMGGMDYSATPTTQGVKLGSMSNEQFTAYVNTSLTQLAYLSTWQVEQQMRQEESQVKTAFITNYRRLHGCDPSDAEVQADYNNYMQIKVSAYNTRQSVSSGLYDKELGISDNKSTPRSTTSGGYKCKKLYATDNAHCNDTGLCSVCNGTKFTRDMIGKTISCRVCYGKGVCPTCGGRK